MVPARFAPGWMSRWMIARLERLVRRVITKMGEGPGDW
jgi:hypothetical protein